MAKKPSKSTKKTPKVMTAKDHHKLADMHNAKESLHRAKAKLLDIQNPSKNHPTAASSKVR